jgi:hypothetical protein
MSMRTFDSAITFIIEAIKLARKAPAVIRRLVTGLLAWCMVIAVTGGCALGLAVWLVPGGFMLQITGGILGALMLAALFAAGRLYQPAACRVYGDLLQDQVPEQTAWRAALRQHGVDSLLLEIAGPLISLQGRRNGHKSGQTPPPEAAWSQARYLVTPVASLENLKLKDSVLRVSQMVNDHLPRLAPAVLGVSQLTAIIAALAGVIGALLGASLGLGLAGLGGAAWQAAGAGIGVLLAGLLTGAGIAFRMLILAAYHTSLYVWAQRAGQARLAGSPDGVVIPPPLAAAFDHHVV